MAEIVQRLKALEDKEKGENLETLIAQLEAYGIRRAEDFDKYRALAMAEDLVNISKQQKHKNASFYAASAQALRDRLNRPTEHFQAYFMALFSDSGYSKVLDHISKVDKTMGRSAPSSTPRSRQRIVCYSCGGPGHMASSCYRRRPYNPNQPRGPRSSSRPMRGGTAQKRDDN